MPVRRRPHPLILLFALQGVIGLLTLSQAVVGDWAPALFADWAPPLVGVTVSAPQVRLSAATLADGGFQGAAQTWVANHVVERAAIIRVFNEVLWDGFGTSYMQNRSLIDGKGGVLFEQGYIWAHCGIAAVNPVDTLPDFARRLRAAENWFARRGKVLVFYIAPVKTSWFPDRVPDDFPCFPNRGAAMVRGATLAAFNQAGVDYVDGPLALEERRGHVPTELFPRNGIHWNWLGAAIGTEALLAKLRALGVTGLPALTYDIGVAPDETGLDRDLADLLNLLRPPPGDPAPTVTVSPPAQAGTLRLAAVNDSFFEYLPMVLLQSGHIFASETVFGYMTLDQRLYANGVMTSIAADRAQIMKTLLDSDVVVLEEVETRVGGPHAQQFLDMVEAEIAREAATPR